MVVLEKTKNHGALAVNCLQGKRRFRQLDGVVVLRGQNVVCSEFAVIDLVLMVEL